MLIIDEVNTMSEVSTWLKKAQSDEVHEHKLDLNSVLILLSLMLCTCIHYKFVLLQLFCLLLV